MSTTPSESATTPAHWSADVLGALELDLATHPVVAEELNPTKYRYMTPWRCRDGGRSIPLESWGQLREILDEAISNRLSGRFADFLLLENADHPELWAQTLALGPDSNLIELSTGSGWVDELEKPNGTWTTDQTEQIIKAWVTRQWVRADGRRQEVT